jgi:hypothetical protein
MKNRQKTGSHLSQWEVQDSLYERNLQEINFLENQTLVENLPSKKDFSSVEFLFTLYYLFNIFFGIVSDV